MVSVTRRVVRRYTRVTYEFGMEKSKKKLNRKKNIKQNLADKPCLSRDEFSVNIISQSPVVNTTITHRVGICPGRTSDTTPVDYVAHDERRPYVSLSLRAAARAPNVISLGRGFLYTYDFIKCRIFNSDWKYARFVNALIKTTLFLFYIFSKILL